MEASVDEFHLGTPCHTIPTVIPHIHHPFNMPQNNYLLQMMRTTAAPLLSLLSLLLLFRAGGCATASSAVADLTATWQDESAFEYAYEVVQDVAPAANFFSNFYQQRHLHIVNAGRDGSVVNRFDVYATASLADLVVQPLLLRQQAIGADEQGGDGHNPTTSSALKGQYLRIIAFNAFNRFGQWT
jgi:hypothetical protein